MMVTAVQPDPVEVILKRARTCKGKRKWEAYELYKNDIGRLGLCESAYSNAIKRLLQAMKL